MPDIFPPIAFAKRLLMGPGPTEVHPSVYEVMTRPVIGHMDPEFYRILSELQQMLRRTFLTDNPITFPIAGTGSAGMEAALVNFIEPGDEAAVLVGGVFADRMCQVIERCGGKVLRIRHEWGTAADPEMVRRALKGKNVKVLAVVHSETSTGVCQPLEPLRDIADEVRALLVVDAVSSLGGLPLKVDEWGVDVCYSGSQKCLACPPGLAPITVSKRATEVLENRRKKNRLVQSWYLDLSLVAEYYKSQDRVYHHTPPISMLFGLHEALRLLLDEGLDAAWRRHEQSHAALVAAVEALGLSMFVRDPELRAWTVNTIRIPDQLGDNFGDVVRRALLEDFKIEIAGGLGELKGKIWRVGLLGLTANRIPVLEFLMAFESVLHKAGYRFDRGAGVAAAEQVFNSVPVPAR